MKSNMTKSYWFKPGYTLVRLVRYNGKPWGLGNGDHVCPEALRKAYGEGIRLEIDEDDLKKPVSGWVFARFVNPMVDPTLLYWVWVCPHVIQPENK